MACCPPAGAEPFTERTARRDARRYRRRGLDRWARRLVATVRPDGASVLEVGGGVGALQLELLRRGALRTANVELSPAYERAAGELAREQGVADAVERHVLDFAASPERVEPADLVLMHRVVCCAPEGTQLVTRAAEHARRTLAFSFPRASWWMRVGAHALNLGARLARWDWRFYVHPPAELLAAAEHAGMRVEHEERGLIWQLAALERRP